MYMNLGCTTIIEIWPGKWAITTKISQIPSFFVAIEKDEKMAPILTEKIPSLDIISIDQWKEWVYSKSIDMANHVINKSDYINLQTNKKVLILADILSFDMMAFLKANAIDPSHTLVVGNLPYYITSPILRKFFAMDMPLFAWWFFMTQKEVGEKITTDAHKKSYLRRLLNYAHDVTYTKTVPAKSFKPAPKVASCLIRITWKVETQQTWYHQKQFASVSNPYIPFSSLISFLDQYSQFKRKTLAASTKILQKQIDTPYVIPPHLLDKRIEELTWEHINDIIR